MREKGCRPNVVSFNTLIKGFFRERKFDVGVAIAGIQPDVYMYTVVVRSLCDFFRAKEMIRRAELNGCDLSVVMYNVLLHGLCKSRRAYSEI